MISEHDRAVVRAQLGREPRSIHEIGHRCPCGNPDVVTTQPRLDNGTPFPTTFYLTCPRAASRIGTLEASGLMREMTDRLAEDAELAAGYLTARHGDALVEEAIAELSAQAVRGVAGSALDEPAVPTRSVDLFGPPRRTLVLRAVSLQSGDDRLGVLVVIDDVTDRRRLEAVRRDFVANISHELKTPVGALGLLAETLLAEDDPEVARRLAERMLAEAFRVGRTIDDLLALSQIEADEAGLRDEVPIGVVTAFVGAPFFAVILRTRKVPTL